ncbi:MAG TPA: hypothetical protein VM345_17995 [Acidimicrobiales bacterium]|jgi:uncharacterized membrane protein YcjF (UPF0283 family)|nr:hypothetical protein [Acidimicrobiales bacterium]
MTVESGQRSRALWRRQLVLTVLAVVAFASVAGITQIALSDWGRSPANRAEALTLAALVGIAVVVLLGAACLHALRIAQLVLRRGETD